MILLIRAFICSFACKSWSQPGLWSFVFAFRNPQMFTVVILLCETLTKVFNQILPSVAYLSVAKSFSQFMDKQMLINLSAWSSLTSTCRIKTSSTRLLIERFRYLHILVLFLLLDVLRCYTLDPEALQEIAIITALALWIRNWGKVTSLQTAGDWAKIESQLSCASNAQTGCMGWWLQ